MDALASELPAEVDDPAVPGYCEGELIPAIESRSVIGTLVENNGRFTMLLDLLTWKATANNPA